MKKETRKNEEKFDHIEYNKQKERKKKGFSVFTFIFGCFILFFIWDVCQRICYYTS